MEEIEPVVLACCSLADMTPCMSPLHHRGPLVDKPGMEQTKDKPEPPGDKKHTGKEGI